MLLKNMFLILSSIPFLHKGMYQSTCKKYFTSLIRHFFFSNRFKAFLLINSVLNKMAFDLRVLKKKKIFQEHRSVEYNPCNVTWCRFAWKKINLIKTSLFVYKRNRSALRCYRIENAN